MNGVKDNYTLCAYKIYHEAVNAVAVSASIVLVIAFKQIQACVFRSKRIDCEAVNYSCASGSDNSLMVSISVPQLLAKT